MAAERPSYMFPSNWEFPPNGPIVLGSLIKNPKVAERHLYTGNVDPSLVTETTKKEFSFSTNNAQSSALWSWTSFAAQIFGVGGDANVSGSRDHVRAFHFDKVVTKYFVPNDAFITDVLRDRVVKQYVDTKWWATVYLVTGIKIAHGARMKTSDGGKIGFEVKAGEDRTSMTTPVSGGLQATFEQDKTNATEFSAKEPFVLAYQLLEIKPRSGLQYEEKDFNRFALLTDSADADSEQREQAMKHLREAWDIKELREPVAEDMQGVELVTSSDADLDTLDFDILVPDIGDGLERKHVSA